MKRQVTIEELTPLEAINLWLVMPHNLKAIDTSKRGRITVATKETEVLLGALLTYLGIAGLLSPTEGKRKPWEWAAPAQFDAVKLNVVVKQFFAGLSAHIGKQDFKDEMRRHILWHKLDDFLKIAKREHGATNFDVPHPLHVEGYSSRLLERKHLIEDPIDLPSFNEAITFIILGVIPFEFNRRTEQGDKLVTEITAVLWEFRKSKPKSGEPSDIHFNIRLIGALQDNILNFFKDIFKKKKKRG